MISFRFHLLSLVAAFLALAVGIVIGTTLADRAIVDGLRSRVESVSANLDERQAANDRLQAENDRLRSFLEDSGGRLVADELVDESVVVIAEQGVDGDAVDRTMELLEDAGASIRSRVEVQPEWELDTPEARAELAADLDIPVDDAASMRSRLSRLLISDLASPVAVPDDDNGVIDIAVAQGLIDYDEVDDLVLDSEQTMTFVVVTGTTGAVESAVVDLSTALVAEGSPTIAAEVFDEVAAEDSGAERGARLLGVRSDPELDAAIATVDHLDLEQGRLAAILTLSDAIREAIGHYGYGPDVDGAAPVAAVP